VAVYAEAMAEAVVKFVLRLAPDLHSALVEWARDEQRSLNGHIVYLLKQAVEQRQRAQ
jgi:hypothetical protein